MRNHEIHAFHNWGYGNIYNYIYIYLQLYLFLIIFTFIYNYTYLNLVQCMNYSIFRYGTTII